MSRRQPAYPRTTGGLVAAVLIIVLVVLGWTLFRAVTSDQPETPVRSVDWKVWVESAKADGKLPVLAPDHLPDGWRATSAKYDSGVTPQLRIGILTGGGRDDERFVGYVLGRYTLETLVAEHVDKRAQAGQDVTIGDTVWHTWTFPRDDNRTDHAYGRLIDHDGTVDALLVFGSAPAEQIRDFAASLH